MNPTFGRSTDGYELYTEVLNARSRAHVKHGNHSIESLNYWDPQFLVILMEEVGELAHLLTYDSVRYDPVTGMERSELEQEMRRRERLREEAIDILAVASAFVDKIDAEIKAGQGGLF